MQKFQDVVLDSQGRPVEGAVIAVQEYPGGGAATVYQTNNVGAAYVPTTDAYGAFFFYAPNGRYSYTVTVANVLRGTVTDVLLYDPDESTTGTWTPTLTGTGSSFVYDEQSGGYVKVGNLVVLTGFIKVNSSSTYGANQISISGLPFSSSTTARRAVSPVLFQNLGVNTVTSILGRIFVNTIELYKTVNSGSFTMPVLLGTDLAFITTLYFSVSYETLE